MKREHQTPNGFFTSIQVFTHFNGTVREERMCARVRENVRERVTPTHAGIFDTTRVLRPKCGFSKVLYLVTLYTKYIRALTFENLSKVIAVL